MKNWNKPKKVDGMDLLFGPKDIRQFIPSIKEIPDEYHEISHPLVKMVENWFFNGLPKDVNFITKTGVNQEEALKHVRCCLCSWELSHEHKMAGCAYLMDLFFSWE